MDEHEEARERAWNDLLDRMARYAYGPGDEALAHLEGRCAAPPVVSAAEIRRLASSWHFDLPTAVKSLRDSKRQGRGATA